jgi:hypothetical protein
MLNVIFFLFRFTRKYFNSYGGFKYLFKYKIEIIALNIYCLIYIVEIYFNIVHCIIIKQIVFSKKNSHDLLYSLEAHSYLAYRHLAKLQMVFL